MTNVNANTNAADNNEPTPVDNTEQDLRDARDAAAARCSLPVLPAYMTGSLGPMGRFGTGQYTGNGFTGVNGRWTSVRVTVAKVEKTWELRIGFARPQGPALRAVETYPRKKDAVEAARTACYRHFVIVGDELLEDSAENRAAAEAEAKAAFDAEFATVDADSRPCHNVEATETETEAALNDGAPEDTDVARADTVPTTEVPAPRLTEAAKAARGREPMSGQQKVKAVLERIGVELEDDNTKQIAVETFEAGRGVLFFSYPGVAYWTLPLGTDPLGDLDDIADRCWNDGPWPRNDREYPAFMVGPDGTVATVCGWGQHWLDRLPCLW